MKTYELKKIDWVSFPDDVQYFTVKYRKTADPDTEINYTTVATSLMIDEDGYLPFPLYINSFADNTDYVVKFINNDNGQIFEDHVKSIRSYPLGNYVTKDDKAAPDCQFTLQYTGLMDSYLPSPKTGLLHHFTSKFTDLLGNFGNAMFTVLDENTGTSFEKRNGETGIVVTNNLTSLYANNTESNGNTETSILGPSGERDYSIGIWVNFNSTEFVQTASEGKLWLWFAGNATNHIGVYIDSTTKKVCWRHKKDTVTEEIINDKPVEQGKWIKVVCQRNWSTPSLNKVTLMMDGVTYNISTGSFSSATNYAGAGGNIYIGFGKNSSNTLVGTKGCFRYFYYRAAVIDSTSVSKLLDPPYPKVVIADLDGSNEYIITRENFVVLDNFRLTFVFPRTTVLGIKKVFARASDGDRTPKQVKIYPFIKYENTIDIDFSAGVPDDNFNAVAEHFVALTKGWGGQNGGVIPSNVYVHNNKLVLEAHGDNYDGSVQGVNKDSTLKYHTIEAGSWNGKMAVLFMYINRSCFHCHRFLYAKRRPMVSRYVAIWFRHLLTDRYMMRQPALRDTAFVIADKERGRVVVKAASVVAEKNGIHTGMVIADARAVFPALQIFDYKSEQEERLLRAIAEWCIRYTPVAAVDLPNGIILDVSGCTHLWGGERAYLQDIKAKLNAGGYDVRMAIADTVGTAWAVSRYGTVTGLVESGAQLDALFPLPPASLRLETAIVQKMEKLGLYQNQGFLTMQRQVLRRRFGASLLDRIDQALGTKHEPLQPVLPIEPYQERLPSLEPIRTAKGIEIALNKLLERLCARLEKEGKGLRRCIFKGYRIDNNVQQVEIGTTKASRNVTHLFKLFEIKIPLIEPALGFELFILEAPVVEEVAAQQETLWKTTGGYDDMAVAELLDRLVIKLGSSTIRRYLPTEHYWPERAIKLAATLSEQPTTQWREAIPRPVQLLATPELITVTVPLPDYPPMLFRYKDKLHKVVKADGPEQISNEWWLQDSLDRDYYRVEDEAGNRYWIFRLGSYDKCEPQWFMHGFFA